jgi:hypothetical protein
MTITEYAATTARAFMAAEIAMASVNCGGPQKARRLGAPTGLSRSA